MEINLATTISELSLKQCIHLWHFANKFQKHKLNLFIGLENNPNQHHLTSLIYKLDWEKRTHNQNLSFNIYFPKEIQSYPPNLNYRFALIENIIKNKHKLDYVVYIDKDVLFSQQQTNIMWEHINNKTNWHGGGSLIYGKNLKYDLEWNYIEEYPLIEKEIKNTPIIGLFENDLKESNYYQNWFKFVKKNFQEGNNMFNWEKK
jgi:hypothetical protein